MAENTVLYEKIDTNLAKITFNRPDALNAINFQLIKDLTSAVDEIEKDNGLRVVILTGAGEKAFIAGSDIRELKKRTPLTAYLNSRLRQGLLRRIECLKQVTIAAINGFALGGGLEVAMACTIRIASEKAKMGQPEINLGIIPGAGGTQRLPRLVGKGRALEMILTGRQITAEEALKIGLVSMVVPHEELMKASIKLAKSILQKSPIALRLAIRAVGVSLYTDIETGTVLESGLLGICFSTEDAKEGISAFLEKRTPSFKGK